MKWVGAEEGMGTERIFQTHTGPSLGPDVGPQKSLCPAVSSKPFAPKNCGSWAFVSWLCSEQTIIEAVEDGRNSLFILEDIMKINLWSQWCGGGCLVLFLFLFHKSWLIIRVDFGEKVVPILIELWHELRILKRWTFLNEIEIPKLLS